MPRFCRVMCHYNALIIRDRRNTRPPHNTRWARFHSWGSADCGGLIPASLICNTSRWITPSRDPRRRQSPSDDRHQMTNTRRWISVGLPLVQRRRRWTNVKPTLIRRLVPSRELGPEVAALTSRNGSREEAFRTDRGIAWSTLVWSGSQTRILTVALETMPADKKTLNGSFI